MSHEKASGRFVIWLTLFGGMLLQIMPLPLTVAAARPEWMLLTISYWILALPHRVNVITACILGVVLDVLVGSTLGGQGLALSLCAYVVASHYRKMRHYSLVQQMAVIVLLAFMVNLIVYWVNYLGNPEIVIDWSYWLPIFSSAFVWPWVFWVLRRTRQQFKVR